MALTPSSDVLGFSPTRRVTQPLSRCRLGVARVDVTPPVGIYHRMWGAATHDRSTGVHRPLTATALVLRPLDEASDELQVFVALDHCLLWAKEMEALLARASERSGIPREALVVTFSHTHAAGLMGLERSELPGGELIAPYLERLADEIGRAISTANKALQPVSILYGYGRCSLAAHRDFWEEEAVNEDGSSGRFVCGFNPDGPADDTLLVARAMDERGRTLATLVNYACHATTLAWQNTLISPDYPGALRELVERETGAPCVFLQGASGDLGPRVGYVGDPDVADNNGRQLGYAALSTLDTLASPAAEYVYRGAVESGAVLGAWEHRPLSEDVLARAAFWRRRRCEVGLPYREGDRGIAAKLEGQRDQWLADEHAARSAGDEQTALVCRAKAERVARQLVRIEGLPPGAEFPMPVTLLQVGGAFWVAVESELYQDFQVALRDVAAAVGAPVVVMTLANGSRPGYLPTADTYGRGIYQESISLVTPGSLEKLTAEVADQIAEWLGDQAPPRE